MATSNDRAKVIALVDKLRELDDDYCEKRAALMTELSAVLGGGEGIGDRLKRVKGEIGAIWQGRHKEVFAFDHVKHTAWLKKKILEHGEAVVIAKWHSYVANDEGYYVRARHSFALFMPGWNNWRGVVDASPIEDSSERLRELRGQ